MGVRAIQVLELLLQRLGRCIRQPQSVFRMAPGRQCTAEGGVAEVFLTVRIPFFLQRQCAIEDKPTRPCELTQLSHLRPIRSQFVLEGLSALHGREFNNKSATAHNGFQHGKARHAALSIPSMNEGAFRAILVSRYLNSTRCVIVPP